MSKYYDHMSGHMSKYYDHMSGHMSKYYDHMSGENGLKIVQQQKRDNIKYNWSSATFLPIKP